MREFTEEELIAIEDAAVKSAENMGAPSDLWIPEYGWILRDGEATEAGLQWYKDNYLNKAKK